MMLVLVVLKIGQDSIIMFLTNPGTDLVYETNELPGETGY